MTAPTPTLKEQFAQQRERFLALQPRERWMLVAGVVAVLLTVIYLGLIEPLNKAHANRLTALESARGLAIKLEQAAQKVQQSRGRGGPAATEGQGKSLTLVVDEASRRSSIGKSPSRMQPEGDGEVRVWFEDVSFDAVIRWVNDLQARYGVKVQTFDVEPQSSDGRVNVRVSLVRGA